MANLFLAVPKSDRDLEIESPSLDGEQNSEHNVFVEKLLKHGDSVSGCDGSRLNLNVFGTRTLQSTGTARTGWQHD